ncbi:hypothetical protein F5887DRAFT_923080 [Amanita rubescens]|nr:hypothetical protein F5887DRAFT_923080 [Amanita rubescens]
MHITVACCIFCQGSGHFYASAPISEAQPYASSRSKEQAKTKGGKRMKKGSKDALTTPVVEVAVDHLPVVLKDTVGKRCDRRSQGKKGRIAAGCFPDPSHVDHSSTSVGIREAADGKGIRKS